MNKSYILLSTLLFTSLYIPATMGMERKYEKQIQPFYKNKSEIKPSDTLPQQFIQLHKDIIINHINPTLKNLPPKDRHNLRLTCKYYAKELAQNPSNWSPMPKSIEQLDNLLSAKKYVNKKDSPPIILAALIEKNDPDAIKWMIDNINPTNRLWWPTITHSLFAKQYGNTKLYKTLTEIEQKDTRYPRNWRYPEEDRFHLKEQREYGYPTIPIYIINCLPSDQQNAFFPSYMLATAFDNVDRLKQLCLEVMPTIEGADKLLMQSKNDAPNCFKYLFEQYKNSKEIQNNAIYYYPVYACNEVIEYLKKQSFSK